MVKDIKARVFDVVFLMVILAVGLGAYHVYGRIRAHNQIDASLVNILSSQDKAQLEQRCTAAGFEKKSE